MASKPFRRIQNDRPKAPVKMRRRRTTSAPFGTSDLPTLPTTPPTEFSEPDGVPHPALTRLTPACGVDPAVFRPDEKVDQVILAMALAANDLINVRSTLHQLHQGEPKEWRFNGYDGARMGMVLWCNRMMASIVHEVLNLVKESEELLASDSDFARVLGEFSPNGRAHWADIVKMATGKAAKGHRKFVELVRHNISYHYHQPKVLAKGYKAAFFKGAIGPSVDYAYVSTSDSYSGVRFYFIDAAIQAAGNDFYAATRDERSDTWTEQIENVSSMLYNIVVTFMAVRREDLLASNASEGE